MAHAVKQASTLQLPQRSNKAPSVEDRAEEGDLTGKSRRGQKSFRESEGKEVKVPAEPREGNGEGARRRETGPDGIS